MIFFVIEYALKLLNKMLTITETGFGVCVFLCATRGSFGAKHVDIWMSLTKGVAVLQKQQFTCCIMNTDVTVQIRILVTYVLIFLVNQNMNILRF